MPKFGELINNTECEVDLEGKRTLENSPLPPKIRSAVDQFLNPAQRSFSGWVDRDFLNRLESLRRYLPQGASLSPEIKKDVMFYLMRHAAFDRAQTHNNHRIGLPPHHTFRALNAAKEHGLRLKSVPDFFLFDVYGALIDRSGLVGLNWDPAYFYSAHKEKVKYLSGDVYKEELLAKDNPAARDVFEGAIRRVNPRINPHLGFSDSHRLSVYLTKGSPANKITGRIPENPEIGYLDLTYQSFLLLAEAIISISGLEVPPRFPSRSSQSPQTPPHQTS